MKVEQERLAAAENEKIQSAAERAEIAVKEEKIVAR